MLCSVSLKKASEEIGAVSVLDYLLMALRSVGNLENWWNPDTEAKFREKAQCIIRQYDDFVHPQVGLHLNGIMTQGENIADNGGIKEAYHGYCEYFSHTVDIVTGRRYHVPKRCRHQFFFYKASRV